jgi:hypothetical protein
MHRMTGPILFVGSIPGENTAEVMALCGKETGHLVTSLSDGETGNRHQWVQFLAARIYDNHPSLETIQRPEEKDGRERWHNESYGEKGWLFRIKEGVTGLHLPHLGYAAAAKKSYLDFVKLRANGEIPQNVRFQVSLPLTESATRIFLTNTHDFMLMSAAYEEAMSREISDMLSAIPAGDLVIQWDLALEVLYIILKGKTPWEPGGDPFERYLASLARLSALIPEETLLGCHYCYGDLGHKHLLEPPDLALPVAMANAAVNAVGRKIDYVHMPVPRTRDDDAYFAPLADLSAGDAKLYLGLVHYTDGVEGTLKRVEAAKRFAADFGIATECGFGRRTRETIPALLQIHREVAAQL